ncbi:DNA polymerase III subunit psi [Vibrio sp. HA2012]|uniref:DNA polymerase III subunit psi n=1 Tax=Vibrio sp. HA2012 TaxID=1971595 RepID=UPI000C2B694F|nr:DNA polymerase III subunit psi [Vibrio sp. HA2012]PJC86133.1 DNA polymerase III subunit psi [Vibrio sp. HA2012]
MNKVSAADYLNEMQIDSWELLHPERLSGYVRSDLPVTLPGECELLLVSPVLPVQEEAAYLDKVLASMQLNLGQVRHIYPQQFAMVDLTVHRPKWVWFAGCESCDVSSVQILSSPMLTDIRGSNPHRRALWQQICSYDRH